MTKIYILTFFFFISFIAKSQNINNEKSANHIDVVGTRLSIVPPNGFSLASNFIGLENNQGSLIQVQDLVGGNYYTNAVNFSKKKFESKGVKIFYYREITVNGFPAKFIHMQGNSEVNAFTLIFGDDTFTTMLMAAYPIDNNKIGKDIEKALYTVVYNKSKAINSLGNTFFKLDDSSTELKFNTSSSNMYIYTKDGFDSKEKDASTLIVMPLARNSAYNLKDLAIEIANGLESKGFKEINILNVSEEHINKYEAYQIQLNGIIKGKKNTIFIQVVANNDKAVVIQGISKKNTQKDIDSFIELSSTIQIK